MTKPTLEALKIKRTFVEENFKITLEKIKSSFEDLNIESCVPKINARMAHSDNSSVSTAEEYWRMSV